MREAIVHVRLLDEGTDCSRPVTALEVAAGIFSLIPSEDYDPDDEKWEFPPGSLVKVVQLQSGSESFTLAIARFDCAEKVIRWQPDLDLPRNLDTPVVTSTYDGGIRITLAEPIPNGRAYTVVFEKPIALRSAKESYRLELMESLGDLLPWPTWTVDGSRWVEWFHEQTHGIYRDWGLKHYLFVGEEVVEVLSTTPPVIQHTDRASDFGWR